MTEGPKPAHENTQANSSSTEAEREDVKILVPLYAGPVMLQDWAEYVSGRIAHRSYKHPLICTTQCSICTIPTCAHQPAPLFLSLYLWLPSEPLERIFLFGGHGIRNFTSVPCLSSLSP